jgi:hypothetical protein
VDDNVKIEHILSAYARPVFLSVTKPDENNDIAIVISTIAFKTMSIPGRIGYIFNLIKNHAPDTLNDRLVVIQAYSPSEMQDLIDVGFNKQPE